MYESKSFFAENIEILTKKNLGKLAVGQAFYAEPLHPVIQL